jgi:hypothetical protein
MNNGSTQWHNAQVHKGICTPSKRSAIGMVDVMEGIRNVFSDDGNMKGSDGSLEQSPDHQQ